MDFLSNKRDWRKWSKDVHTGGAVEAPLRFPCYAYLTVGSWNYEEDAVNYLYLDDLLKMLDNLRKP